MVEKLFSGATTRIGSHACKRPAKTAIIFPGYCFRIQCTLLRNLSDCADADLIVLATPSTALRNIAAQLAKIIGPTRAVLLSCTKGIEHGSGMRMTEILRETFPENKIAVLSGPNLATEVARDLPTATVIACDDGDCAARLQTALGSPRFRIYTSLDVVSVELGGALKNVFAIAAGISDGLGLGDNAKAALVTRSLAELVRFGVAMGGTANAFYGLSGAGDLILTCYSERSRNHTVGQRLGRGEPLPEIIRLNENGRGRYSDSAKRLGMRAALEYCHAYYR